MAIELVMSSNHLILCPPLPAFNLFQHQGLFQWVFHIRWPTYWSFSLSISPSNEYSGLVSFRIDWFDLLADCSNCQTSVGSLKRQESSRKTSTSALLIKPKPLTVWITTKCGKFWKRWAYQTTLPASWEICTQVKKQWTWNNGLVPNCERSTSKLYFLGLQNHCWWWLQPWN